MKLEHYHLAIVVSIPISIILCCWHLYTVHASVFIAITIGAITLSPPVALAICIILFISAVVSGAGYLGLAADAIFNPWDEILRAKGKIFKPWFKKGDDGKYKFCREKGVENVAVIIGVALGIIVGLVLFFSGVMVPLFTAIPMLPQIPLVLSACVFILSIIIGPIAGLFARAARVVDELIKTKTKPESKSPEDKDTKTKTPKAHSSTYELQQISEKKQETPVDKKQTVSSHNLDDMVSSDVDSSTPRKK